MGKQASHRLELVEVLQQVTMMAASTLFRVFLILLALSHHLICLKAVPVTRTESLMQAPQVHQINPENNLKVIKVKNWHWKESTSTNSDHGERMDLELQDYSPPGANGRHTPKAP